MYSPYVAGQAVVCISTGGVAIYNEDGSGGHVVSSSGSDDLGRVHVTFGSHPQHVLGLWRGNLHSIDLHSAVVSSCIHILIIHLTSILSHTNKHMTSRYIHL